MSNDLASHSPACDSPRSPRFPGVRHAGWATTALVAMTVALAVTGCGARAARRDASSTTSTTAPAATSTSTGPTATIPTDDIEQDLTTVQSDLDGAAKDLSDGQTEATTDARG